MFDKDKWLEILQVILRRPGRAILSGIGVAWGIFMLLVLLGAVQGLTTGVKQEFGNRATNSMSMWTMSTTMEYAGFSKGRNLKLRIADIEYLKENIPQIDVVCPRLQLGGWRGSNNVNKGTKTAPANVYGESPDFLKIQPLDIAEGRFINHGDMLQKRKVCVIGNAVVKSLFEKDQNPIGDYITVNGVIFDIIGIFKSLKTGEDKEEEENSVYIPHATFQKSFNRGDGAGWVSILSKGDYPVQELQKTVIKTIKERLNVHPEDPRAIGAWNMSEEMEEIEQIFSGMTIVGYFVGFLVLLAGAIGICNIMLISVSERTKELGVRRSLGATPNNIISQILTETLLLTAIAGLIGMLAGVGTIALVNYYLPSMGDTGAFKEPQISFFAALSAVVIMMIFGTLAGLLPAAQAVKIKPVDALRKE